MPFKPCDVWTHAGPYGQGVNAPIAEIMRNADTACYAFRVVQAGAFIMECSPAYFTLEDRIEAAHAWTPKGQTP